MNDSNAVNAIKDLHDLNIKLGEAEKSVGRDPEQIDWAALESLKGMLSDDLSFRRASGVFVGKKEFLADLEERNVTYDYDVTTSEVTQVIVHEGKSKGQTSVDQGLATVEVLVQAKGKRVVPEGSDPNWQGVYRNTRVFCKEGTDWKLVLWFNTRIGDLPSL